MNIALLISEFNREITEKMEKAAENRVKQLGHSVAERFYIYGVLDCPLPLEYLLKKKNVDAAVLLGTVVSGETDHDKIVVDAARQAVVELQLKHGKPIGWGVSGPAQTWKQAEQRAEEYANRAVEAVVKINSQLKK